jgi:hypothetical protein
VEVTRRVAVLETTLGRQLSWIAAADAKTAFIFALATAMLGLLASASPAYGKWTVLGVAFTSIAASLLLISLSCVVLAVFPRTKGPKLSVIFFGGIAARHIDEFRVDVQGLSEEAYEEDLVQQCHINAQIAGVKYQWLKAASVLLAASVVPWLAAAYVLLRDK